MTKNSKKAQGIIWAYNRSSDKELYHVYDNFSRAKAEAFDDCLAIQREYDGYDGRITGANTYHFSYAFRYMKDDKEWMMYITHANNITFCLDD